MLVVWNSGYTSQECDKLYRFEGLDVFSAKREAIKDARNSHPIGYNFVAEMIWFDGKCLVNKSR